MNDREKWLERVRDIRANIMMMMTYAVKNLSDLKKAYFFPNIRVNEG